MNFQLSTLELAHVLKCEKDTFNKDFILSEVVCDTRKIINGKGVVFFALQGKYRNGASFINEAYQKGVRVFVLRQLPNKTYDDAIYLRVVEPLNALIEFAGWYRKKFQIPVIAIIGTHGKTTIKEWVGLLLKEKYHLVKSPKSYNSKLGVAMSLLGLHKDAEMGLFEVSITQKGEGALFRSLIQPTHTIISHVGIKHNESFSSTQDKHQEYTAFLKGCDVVFRIDDKNNEVKVGNKNLVHSNATAEMQDFGFNDKFKAENSAISKNVASFFGIKVPIHYTFSDLAMRLETFAGIHDSLIINDTYSLDLESLETALQYQLNVAKNRKRILFLPKSLEEQSHPSVKALIKRFGSIDCRYIDTLESDLTFVQNSVVLVKGNQGAFMNKFAHSLKLKHHRTKISVNLGALRKNIHVLKDLIPDGTKSLVMVKANAYGTGLIETASFIEGLGVDYLGVAYTDEGVTLRENGVKCPILVMSPGPDDFQDCIFYELEPSIYSLQLLDDFIKLLILKNKVGFPIHLKLDTGMHRLGIIPKEIPNFIDILNTQPEIHLKGVYSHFSESDNTKDHSFTEQQLDIFEASCDLIKKYVSYPFIRHIANSGAIVNYPHASFDMVRMGLVVYGVTAHSVLAKKLKQVIEWTSEVVQIKKLKLGDTIGYNRAFTAQHEMDIAVIPVGYADGFRRALSQGKGYVFIDGKKCKTLGNVCMDMLMVDITGMNVLAGASVEIIGKQQNLMNFASQLETIPYEVLTSLSLRVHRNYIVT